MTLVSPSSLDSGALDNLHHDPSAGSPPPPSFASTDVDFNDFKPILEPDLHHLLTTAN